MECGDNTYDTSRTQQRKTGWGWERQEGFMKKAGLKLGLKD